MSKKYCKWLAMLAGCFSAGGLAVDVTVQVNGKILAQSCNVQSSDLIRNVIFDDLDPASFTAIGSTSPEQKVTVGLENCTGNVKNLSYTFTGEPDDINSDLLKITGKTATTSDGLATGLAIEILDANQTAIPLNQQQAFNQTITSSNYSFIFYLRYKSVSTKVTSGDASSILYLDMYYE